MPEVCKLFSIEGNLLPQNAAGTTATCVWEAKNGQKVDKLRLSGCFLSFTERERSVAIKTETLVTVGEDTEPQ